MDRQRSLVLGAVGAVLVVFVLAVGVVIGRASAGGGTDEGGSEHSAGSDGLPDGPAGLEDGVPVGFARSEDGAVAAALAWVPWLLSTPVGDRPGGIEMVLAAGVEAPIPESLSLRMQFVPVAARATMSSATEVQVTLLGTLLSGGAGDVLDGGVMPIPTTLVWDEDVGDWRVSAIDIDQDFLDVPVQAEDVSGFRVVRSHSGVLGGVVIEEVPGE